MKIKKIEQSIALIGKVLNNKTNTPNDAYSCEYINNMETEIENKIPNISYGTTEPTGGSNGDIYIKYTE